MSPDELRAAADDVDNWTDPTGNAHVVAGAARRLADVMKVYEARCDQTVDNCSDEMEMLLSDISMAIHGENFRDFSERG